MRNILRYIQQRFSNPDILITENGISDRNGYLDDAMRIYYHKYYINNVLKGNMELVKRNKTICQKLVGKLTVVITQIHQPLTRME